MRGPAWAELASAPAAVALTVRATDMPPIQTTSVADVQIISDLSAIGEEKWNRLWRHSEVPTVFTRYEWVTAWWQTFRSMRDLRLYVLYEDDEPLGILPLVWPRAPRAPVFLVGDDHADYAGVLTRAGRTDVFMQLLRAVSADLRYGQCLRLHDIREDSSYFSVLRDYTRRSLCWMMTAPTPCPRTSLDATRVDALLSKRSLRRHSRKLRSAGTVEVRHYQDADAIMECLDGFFEQHIARWASTPYPSLFSKPENRHFYRALARSFDRSGHLIYTEIVLDGRAVACHFGFISERDLVWYKPSFDVEIAEMSPGEVLLAELIRMASGRRLTGLDFTRGGEPFKHRFADQTRKTFTFTYCQGIAPAAIAAAINGARNSWHHVRAVRTRWRAGPSAAIKRAVEVVDQSPRHLALSPAHLGLHLG